MVLRTPLGYTQVNKLVQKYFCDDMQVKETRVVCEYSFRYGSNVVATGLGAIESAKLRMYDHILTTLECCVTP